jgi:hypothetical protein
MIPIAHFRQGETVHAPLTECLEVINKAPRWKEGSNTEYVVKVYVIIE